MSVAITWRKLSVTSENQEAPHINTKPRFAGLLGTEYTDNYDYDYEHLVRVRMRRC